MQEEKNSRKSKQRNKCGKIIIGLKIFKLKLKKKKEKGKLSRTAKAQHRGRGYKNNKKCD